MKKSNANSKPVRLNCLWALTATGSLLALCAFQFNLFGRESAQSASAPPILKEGRILRYGPGHVEPVPLLLTETRLFFGLSRLENNAVVTITPSEWDSFLATSVRPLFDSFTVIDAMGEYRGQRERTKILLLFHQEGDDDEKIETVAANYIARFNQDGVVRIDE